LRVGRWCRMPNSATSEELRWAALVQRHHNLVDRKYAIGLTATEAEELNRLNNQLDQLDGPLYQTIVDHVRDITGRRL